MFNSDADIVFITGLTVEAVIGVFAWERAITQPILIDIALTTDISQAALSDDVADALSYKEVCDDVDIWCQDIKAKLLEHLAGQLADKILDKYNCQKVTLSAAKPTAIKNANAVGVQITRYGKNARNNADNSTNE